MQFLSVVPRNVLAMFLFVPYGLPMGSKHLNTADEAERRRVGATIKQLRDMRGYTADQFANKIGVSRPYLTNIECGRKPLTERLLFAIANELGVEQVVIVRDGYFQLAVPA